MEFVTLRLEDWQAALNRGLDVLSFSAPPAFLTVYPNVFQPLFAQAVDDLDAVHGHAGYAVNLSLLRRDPNAASEYFLARRYGPGLDVGDPVLVVPSRMTRP
ncbi:bacteriophage gp31 protein [Burkholderia pseudomallei]|nr:bacteriophage gp31 protein [Burkholderia pseudomallei]